MIETKEKNKKIQISENDLIEGQPIIDYLISSIEETGNKTLDFFTNLSKQFIYFSNEIQKGALFKIIVGHQFPYL